MGDFFIGLDEKEIKDEWGPVLQMPDQGFRVPYSPISGDTENKLLRDTAVSLVRIAAEKPEINYLQNMIHFTFRRDDYNTKPVLGYALSFQALAEYPTKYLSEKMTGQLKSLTIKLIDDLKKEAKEKHGNF